MFTSEESAGNGGRRHQDKGHKGRTLSIFKSGSIQIEGFEIRRSGLLTTPLKNAPPRTGRAGPDGGTDGAAGGGMGVGHGGGAMMVMGEGAKGGAILSTQLADGGLWSLQDALAPLTVLGRGAGGTVWQAVHVPSLRVVAVKTIPVFEEGRRHQMVRELRALYANLVREVGDRGMDDIAVDHASCLTHLSHVHIARAGAPGLPDHGRRGGRRGRRGHADAGEGAVPAVHGFVDGWRRRQRGVPAAGVVLRRVREPDGGDGLHRAGVHGRGVAPGNNCI